MITLALIQILNALTKVISKLFTYLPDVSFTSDQTTMLHNIGKSIYNTNEYIPVVQVALFPVAIIGFEAILLFLWAGNWFYKKFRSG